VIGLSLECMAAHCEVSTREEARLDK
jgi:hypothetical protein